MPGEAADQGSRSRTMVSVMVVVIMSAPAGLSMRMSLATRDASTEVGGSGPKSRFRVRRLPINRKQKVFPNGTLIIENVERMTDQATYTCVARNAQGYSARGTLEVQVMGKLGYFYDETILQKQMRQNSRISFI